MSVTTLTSENFDAEVFGSDKPVLVDFFAEWCGPCRMVSPIVEEIAEETEDIKICKVNVDEQPELAQKFAVSSVPTLAVFREGKIYRTSVGAKSKQAILEMFD